MKTQEKLHGNVQYVGYLLKTIGHLCAVGVLGVLLGVGAAPHTNTWGTLQQALNTPWMRDDALVSLALHFGVSACLWAMLYLFMCAVQLHRRERATRVFRMARGSVMTETLIILPIWMLLVFGLAQVAINNIAGVLANVAVYEGARAAWVWEGEGRGSGGGDQAAERSKIAAAAVMTPVAPGEFIGDPSLSDEGEKMRMALALSHIPLSAEVGGLLSSDVASMAATLGSTSLTMPTEGNKSVMRALDTEAFLLRTLKKFTHAYHATSTTVSTVDGRATVELEYKHMSAMPYVSRIFGDFETVSGRPGYYLSIKRSYGFKSQSENPPNGELPVGTPNGSAPPEYDATGGINSGAENACTEDCG